MRSLHVIAGFIASVLVGCTDAPQLQDLACQPTEIHATPAAPVALACDVAFDGNGGDVRWFAHAADGALWHADSDTISESERSQGKYHFTISKPTPPPAGTLAITFQMDDVEGIDGPAGDEIELDLDVLP